MELILIAVVGNKNIIGNKGKISWSIPDDLKRFKELTSGFPVIMGRKTYESLPGKNRPLPGRSNIVLTRDKNFRGEGIVTANSIDDAVSKAYDFGRERAYVIGGSQVYNDTIGQADRLEITHVSGDFEGDAFFPEIDYREWEPYDFGPIKTLKDIVHYWATYMRVK